MRRHVPNELVRIDFNFFGDVTAHNRVVFILEREITPFIIGVGEVVTHKTPEGFIVVLADDGDKRVDHDLSRSCGANRIVSAKMIAAGIEAIEPFELIDICDGFGDRSDFVRRIFLQMAKAQT
jgi:hypothetical protein